MQKDSNCSSWGADLIICVTIAPLCCILETSGRLYITILKKKRVGAAVLVIKYGIDGINQPQTSQLNTTIIYSFSLCGTEIQTGQEWLLLLSPAGVGHRLRSYLAVHSLDCQQAAWMGWKVVEASYLIVPLALLLSFLQLCGLAILTGQESQDSWTSYVVAGFQEEKWELPGTVSLPPCCIDQSELQASPDSR